MGECVAVFGGGGHQARSVLKEELDKVGVVVLCGEMDRLLVQVVVGVDSRLKKFLPIQIAARDNHVVSVYAYIWICACMIHSQMLGKVESGGRPFLKVVLEC